MTESEKRDFLTSPLPVKLLTGNEKQAFLLRKLEWGISKKPEEKVPHSQRKDIINCEYDFCEYQCRYIPRELPHKSCYNPKCHNSTQNYQTCGLVSCHEWYIQNK
jgi:hypothetical protein